MQTLPEASERSVSALFQDLDVRNALSAIASGENGLPARSRVNAHIHLPPNFSAFDSVEEAVRLAANEQIRVLGASNYYDYQVYSEFAAEAERRGIFPLFGLEIIALVEHLVLEGVRINDPGNPGKMYICGKGIGRFDPMSPEAIELLTVIRDKDSERMARMTDCLAQLFAAAGLDTGLNEDVVKESVVRRHGSPKETVYLQERHVAQAFQEALFERVRPEARPAVLEILFGVEPKSGVDDAASVQNEIRAQLMKAGKPAYIEETFVDFSHAYRLILALGGIPCYPTLADGASPICQFETPVEKLIEEIKGRGIPSAEMIPVRNSPEVLAHYATSIRAAGLVVTAGTEHNTRETLPLEPTCVKGAPIPEEVRELFWEGACVVAAHQVLVLRGEPGFVDGEGNPNPAYRSPEERIAAFSALGADLIRQFQDRFPAPAGRLPA